MKFPRWALAITAMVPVCLLTVAQTPTASAATFTAQLVARNSQRCVSVEAASIQSGAQTVQLDCMDSPSQQWRLVATSPGYYTIRAVTSDKCLSIEGPSLDNRARAILWECQGAQTPNQEWRLVQKDSGYFSIEARHSGKCLSVSGGSAQSGAILRQFDCQEAPNQHFRLG
jgi:hypothetical protein